MGGPKVLKDERDTKGLLNQRTWPLVCVMQLFKDPKVFLAVDMRVTALTVTVRGSMGSTY